MNDCIRCGKQPKFKSRTENLGGNDGSVNLLWIECSCGLRTIDIDDYYGENERKQKLIKIWNI